jgi:hypothetical protein
VEEAGAAAVAETSAAPAAALQVAALRATPAAPVLPDVARSPLPSTTAAERVAANAWGQRVLTPNREISDTNTARDARPASALTLDVPAPAASPAFNLSTPAEELPPESAYLQRFAEDRLQIVERMGGSAETEQAVQDALKWLAAHQSPDGRWDPDGFDSRCGQCGGETPVHADNALTGLGLLCFLGAGHTHLQSGPYQETVERGLKWLASRQKSDGDLRGEETMYSHGIAAIALSEAFALTGDARLREPAQRAVTFIEKARNRSVGGWRYDPGQAGDTSVLGWQMMALKSASMAGLDVAPSAFEAGKSWLRRVSDRRNPGRYAYQPGRESTPAMTAEALFVQQILGTPPSDPQALGSVKYILQHLPRWDEANTYFWYYAALALFQNQGTAWEQWNAAMRRELVAHQRHDGAAAGSWDPVGEWADVGGRVYQTALCTLMLEVYYRYLPLYSMEPSSQAQAAADAGGAIGTIRGKVTDAATGRPLTRATVRLDLPDGDAVEVQSEPGGAYMLGAPQVPEFFALSASLPGYVPKSVSVERVQLEGQTLQVDFVLEPASSAVLVTEPVPDVHHLGDNHFEGTINSQFQKRSEGSEFSVSFELSADQLAPVFNHAEVRLLAKGVQRSHRIVINGETLHKRLSSAPGDGSFGEFSAPIPQAALQNGTNILQIIAAPSEDDIDDFEFVNIQIRLAP